MGGSATRLAILMCLGALVLGACKATPLKYDVNVSIDENLTIADSNKHPTFEVHLVAISDIEKGSWETRSVDTYFAQGEHRNSVVMAFSDEHAEPRTLRWNDDRWKEWKGRPWLVILTNAPIVGREESPRRRFVPLWDSCWESDIRLHRKPIEILVGPHGLSIETPPKPGCP